MTDRMKQGLSTVALLWHGTKDKTRLKIDGFKEALAADRKGWLICLAVLIVTVARSGITYSFGVFVVDLEKTYHTSMAEQNWIGTLSFCISLTCAPLSVAFIRSLKYRGYRWGGIIGTVILSVSCLGSSFIQQVEWMFLTHSLLYGIGSSLIYMASSLVIGEYFDKDHSYHVMATSILLCGYPIGSLIFNPVNAWLVTRFGWRVAFRCSSGLILMSGLVCCWSFSSKDSPNRQRLTEDEDEEDPTADLRKLPRRCCTFQDIKSRPEIMLWYIANCLTYLGFYMPFLNLAFYMELKHIGTVKSSWALTMLSFAECITYIMASWLGDYLKGKLVYVNVIAAGALAVICGLWPFMDVSYSVICLIAIAMGGFLGLTIVYTYAASGEVTELSIDIAWSFTNMWSGLGILLGPFFSGFVYDFRKSYDDVFYIVGFLFLLDCGLFVVIVILRRRRVAQQMSTYTDMDSYADGSYKQTFRITKRSISKSSLANGDTEGVVPDYGTTGSVEPPTKPPPPKPSSALPTASDFTQRNGWEAFANQD